MECILLHLQTIFRCDAEEVQRFYISNGFKKPIRVPIQHFLQRIQCLNKYLDLLPCLYYSSRAAKSTRVLGPFNDTDLASLMLRMVPWDLQEQYWLCGATVLQSVRELIEAFECI